MGDGQADQADREMMALALHQARVSLEAGGVPVGAVLAEASADGRRELIAAGHNERVQRGDPVAHGEIACLRNAGRRPSYAGTILYTTLSPCQMCTGAILLFQIPRVVVGEAETFAGDLDFLAGRGVEVVLLEDQACVAVMEEFQRRYPQIWSEDIGGRRISDVLTCCVCRSLRTSSTSARPASSTPWPC
jgi:cytosine/creatinine deaminase